jgi:hypothetical protein
MLDTVVSDRSESVSDESRLRLVRAWIPLALGALAIVIGGVLFSPHPVGEPEPGPRSVGVSASP